MLKPGEEVCFSLKYCCRLLENLCLAKEGVSLEEEMVFGYLWKSRTPSKVLAFSWILLLDRIPIRSNLAK